MTNPWLFLLTIIWIVCGVVSIIQKNENSLVVAFISSACLGFGYAVVHHL